MLLKESKAHGERGGCQTRKTGLWAPGDVASSWEGARDLLSETLIPGGPPGGLPPALLPAGAPHTGQSLEQAQAACCSSGSCRSRAQGGVHRSQGSDHKGFEEASHLGGF